MRKLPLIVRWRRYWPKKLHSERVIHPGATVTIGAEGEEYTVVAVKAGGKITVGRGKSKWMRIRKWLTGSV